MRYNVVTSKRNMRFCQSILWPGAIALAITGCSCSSDPAPVHTSQFAATVPRILADDQYIRASSLASTPQERVVVASARRKEGKRTDRPLAPEMVFEMRVVLIESETAEVRAAAAAGMGNSRDLETTPDLLDAMEDESVLVRETAAQAVGRLLGWKHGFRADDPLEKRQETIAQYRERWTKFQNSSLYQISQNPAAKANAKRLAERKARANRRRERHPGNRKEEGKLENNLPEPGIPPERRPRPSREEFEAQLKN